MNIRMIHDEFCRDGGEEGDVLEGCGLYVKLKKLIREERKRCEKIVRNSAIVDEDIFRVIEQIHTSEE